MAQLTDYIEHVCKIGQREKCCKYLVVDPEGFACMKANPANKAVIDKAWKENDHIAQGDNCRGQYDLTKATSDDHASDHKEENSARKN